MGVPVGMCQQSGPCDTGFIVQLSSGAALQGDLVQVELGSKNALTEVSGDWQERKVLFWPLPSEASNSSELANVWRGLVGVDLEKEAGRYELLVNAKGPDGKPISCKVTISVGKGIFATERLQVQKQFVEPSPKQLERSNRERQRLRAIFDTTSPEKLWRGAFRVPLDGAPKGGNFGKRRVLNGQAGSPHTGVDFPSLTGTAVHASQRGRVVLAEELFFSGNTVVLDHGFGIYTFYGHLSEIEAKLGDLLDAGAMLGKVGATGRVTGPHLHWGLTVERARVDPLKLVNLSSTN
jgi:murein DD-endopeptidase MepM/ murein hydrolase activator NlpD